MSSPDRGSSLLRLADLGSTSHVSALHAACARAAVEQQVFGASRQAVTIANRRFRILRSLGGGGMGVVYEVETEDHRRLALKLLRGASASAIATLKREFRVLAGLDHEGLVAYEDLLVSDAGAAITMELVDGVDFVTYARAQDGPSLVECARRLAHALCAVHDAGVVHCDVKPSNVLVTPAGRVVLLDFGIATREGRDDPGGGTDAFIAPEQRAYAPATAAADCWAAGVLLARALDALAPEARDPRLVSATVQLSAADPAERLDARGLLRAVGGAEPSRPLPSLLVGRDEALAELHTLVAAPAARLAFVKARSGFGKTALVDRFANEVSGLCLRGRCQRREVLPHRALDEVIDELVRYWLTLDEVCAARLVPADITALARVFPALTQVPHVAMALEAIDAPDPNQLRRRAIVAARDVIARLAETRRVVVVIDDAQWADDDGLFLLEELLRGPGEPSFVLVIATRPEAVATQPRLAALVGRADARIELGPLAPDQAERLLVDLAPNMTTARQLAVMHEAGGDPFLLRELARQDAANLPGRGSAEAIVASRLPADDAALRDAAALLALALQPVDESLLASAAGVMPAEATRCLRALRAARLARHATAGGTTTELAHDRFTDAVRGGLDEASRRAGHRRLARALEARADADPDVLVHHCVEAGEMTRAADHALAAAGLAEQRLAFDRAARLYALILELAPERADGNRLALARADALARAGRGEDAAAAYEAVAARTQNSSDALRLRRRAAEELLMTGRLGKGLELLDAVLTASGMRRARTTAGSIASIVWQRLRLKLRGLEPRAHTDAKVSGSLYDAIDTALTVSRTLGTSDLLTAYDFNTRALLLALRAGEPTRLARTLSAEAVLRGITGRDSEPLARASLAFAHAAGEPSVVAVVHATLALRAFGVGDPREAAARASMATAIYRQHAGVSGAEPWLARYLELLARSALGEAGLRPAIEEGIRSAAERGDVLTQVAFQCGLAHETILAGDVARARREVDQAMALREGSRFDSSSWTAVYRHAQADLAEGDPAAARARLRDAWSQIARSGVLRVPMLRAHSHHLDALLAVCAGDAREATRSTRRLRKDPTPFAQALAAQLDAIASADVDRCEAAAASLQQLGWTWYANATRLRAAELAGEPAAGRLVDELSARGVADPRRFLAAFAPPLARQSR